jgi:hypothetical protein
MKRIKIVLNAIAITVAIAGALATRFYTKQEDQPQYIPCNNTYLPAGEYGIDYNCFDSAGECTFYRPDSLNHPNQFLPCKRGRYQAIHR